MPASRAEIKFANLALQGDTHGAFTWGVLDLLLQEERITFEGISAASAGAINAVVFVGGMVEGRRSGVNGRSPNFGARSPISVRRVALGNSQGRAC
jgi:NTE family protein